MASGRPWTADGRRAGQQEVQPRGPQPNRIWPGREGRAGPPTPGFCFPTLQGSPPSLPTPTANWALTPAHMPLPQEVGPGGHCLPSCSPKCCAPRTSGHGAPSQEPASAASQAGCSDQPCLWAPGALPTRCPVSRTPAPNCACGRNPNYPESCQEIKDMPTFFKTSL